MQIDLSKLFEREDASLDITCPLELENVYFSGKTCDFTDKSEVELRVLRKSKRQLEVTGVSKFKLQMFCTRCLEPTEVSFDLKLCVKLDFERLAEGLDELPYVSGYSLDVDLLVLDELFVNMPISVLCSDDCKGLCRGCGKNLNLGPCDCDNTVLDPRMAKILDIYNANNKEV